MILRNILCKANKIGSIKNLIVKQERSYHISIEPKSCLQDIPAAIRATGLKPNEKVTVTIRYKNAIGEDLFSYAYYNATLEGCVDLTKHFSQGGSYTGCLPMGLISSLQQVNPEKRFKFFIYKDVEKPLQLKVSLLPGHVDGDTCAAGTTPDCLASSTHERYYMAEGCRRLVVREGKVRGSLFLPPGLGPFPGIIDIYGASGGLKELRAAQLASNGIAALALAYFRYDGLPETMEELDIGYFDDAVQYLLGRKEVIPNGAGAIGYSKGAEIVMAMGTYIKEVKAVVSISGIPANTLYPMRVNNTVVPPLSIITSNVTFVDGLAIIKEGIQRMYEQPEAIVPMEKADAKFMFVIGKNDQCCNSVLETHLTAERLRSNGFFNFEVVECDGAGHCIEPPFTPFRDRFYHSVFKNNIYAGGQVNTHTKAEQMVWTKLIAFFKDNLSMKI